MSNTKIQFLAQRNVFTNYRAKPWDVMITLLLQYTRSIFFSEVRLLTPGSVKPNNSITGIGESYYHILI